MTCDCEAPDVYEESVRRARKAHWCCECAGAIGPGEEYQYISGLWDGRWDSFKTCRPCALARRFFSRSPEIDGCGVPMGALLSTVREAFCWKRSWNGIVDLVVNEQSAEIVGRIMGLLWRQDEVDHDVRQVQLCARRHGRLIVLLEARREFESNVSA